MVYFIVLLAAHVALVWARKLSYSDHPSSRLMIHIPHSLYKEGGYDHRVAQFGVPLYGGSIAQNVYYAESELCDSNVDTSTGVPTRATDKHGKMLPWPSPFILMVDRGGCTFVQKVRNAQRAGAVAVLIADTTCRCYDEECVKANSVQTCETAEPIMADDGSGGDITIPSFLMFKLDADAVKNELKQDNPVQLEMRWSLPNQDDHVEYDLWTVPSDLVSLDFLKNFKAAAVALGSHAYFTPHMYVYDGIKSHCIGTDGQNMCYNLCTNNGRYCATDPDNGFQRGVSGADVVKESLRRICIWKHYGEKDGIGEKWWDYVSTFINQCNTADYFSSEACAKDSYRKAGIDGDIITRCMNDSGGLIANKVNALLEMELRAQNERGVVVLPTAFVNGVALRKELSVNNVFVSICSGFLSGTAPKICQQCASCSDPNECIKGGGVSCCPSQISSSSTTTESSILGNLYFFTMIVVGFLLMHLGMSYKKPIVTNVKDDVPDQEDKALLAECKNPNDHDGN